MLTGHSNIGVSQISLFLPSAIATVYLLLIRHRRLRLPWYFLLYFCLVRVTTGIFVVLHEDHPESTGLTTAAIVLLAVGVVPLLITTLGLIQIELDMTIEETLVVRRSIVFVRFLLLTSVSLIVAGGSLEGSATTESLVETGVNIVKAGYIFVVVTFAILVAFQVYIFLETQKDFPKSSKMIMKALAVTNVLLAVRITYSFLSVFSSGPGDYKWSPIYGSVTASSIMVLSTECIIVGIYLAVGFFIPAMG